MFLYDDADIILLLIMVHISSKSIRVNMEKSDVKKNNNNINNMVSYDTSVGTLILIPPEL